MQTILNAPVCLRPVQQLLGIGFPRRTTGMPVDCSAAVVTVVDVGDLELEHEDLMHAGPIQKPVPINELLVTNYPLHPRPDIHVDVQ